MLPTTGRAASRETISAAGSGTLLERHVVRGGRVRRRARLFKLEQDRGSPYGTRPWRVQRALATLGEWLFRFLKPNGLFSGSSGWGFNEY
jgi:hypothetical protein